MILMVRGLVGLEVRMHMNEMIVEKLKNIECCNNVKILMACEAGGRAWGWAGPDSDYDVRFVYVSPVDHYLCLQKFPDTIECQIGNNVTITGWDLQKYLKLLRNGNPSIFEWYASPIKYAHDISWSCVDRVIHDYFNPKVMLQAYAATINNNLRKRLVREVSDDMDSVSISRYFLSFRLFLACCYSTKRKNQELLYRIPPASIDALLTDGGSTSEYTEKIKRWLGLRRAGEIGKYISYDATMNSYLTWAIRAIYAEIETMKNIDKKDWYELNELFLKVVHGDA